MYQDIFYCATTLMHEFCNHTQALLDNDEDVSKRIEFLEGLLVVLTEFAETQPRVPVTKMVINTIMEKINEKK